MREQAVKTWERTASLLHSNRDFRLNSQKSRHVHHAGRDAGWHRVAKRAAVPGPLDMAAAALGEFYVGPDDVLVVRDASAAGTCQDDDL